MTMVTAGDLTTEEKPEWCPGCGNFIILKALKEAIVQQGLEPHRILIVSGIGQAGKTPQSMRTFGYHGIHGRALPIATGARLANHTLKIIVIGGDGDGYGIGMGHFIHAMRRNLDLTYLVHNNQVYGLTKGQTAPTSIKGFKTKSTPMGSIEEPVNPIALAIAGGATFVARAYYKHKDDLTQLIIDGMQHKGFALIDIAQYCITFNKVNTPAWYDQRVYKLADEQHDPTNKIHAFEKALEWGERIPLGLFYRESRSTYEDELPQIKDIPLVHQPIDDVNINALIESFF